MYIPTSPAYNPSATSYDVNQGRGGPSYVGGGSPINDDEDDSVNKQVKKE